MAVAAGLRRSALNYGLGRRGTVTHRSRGAQALPVLPTQFPAPARADPLHDCCSDEMISRDFAHRLTWEEKARRNEEAVVA